MCSSSTVSSFSARPSCVLEATKSYDQTWPRYSAASAGCTIRRCSHSRPRFGCRCGDLQPLLPPDPLHPLVVHPPALDAEHVRDASVAVAAESTRESHDITSERPLVTRHFPRPALGRAWLPDAPSTLSSPTAPRLLTYTHHTTSSALGAQKFPSAASSRISLSSVNVRHCSTSGARSRARAPVRRTCLAHLHPAVLPPPPVATSCSVMPSSRLISFTDLTAGQTDLCLPQCSDDLLRSVSLPSHPDLLAVKLQTRSILTLHLVSFQGVRSGPRDVARLPKALRGDAAPYLRSREDP